MNPFSTVQATWNLLEPSVEPALEEARAAGWGVIVKEAVANGRLAVPEAAPAELDRIASAHGVTPDAVAIAAVLSQPWADVCLSGAVSPDQLLSNVAAPGVALTDEDLERLRRLAEPPEQYWKTRAALAWH
jgi:aryl-alcohol dehydrogenase-like predicted oxidoreductase